MYVSNTQVLKSGDIFEDFFSRKTIETNIFVSIG